jgi:haloalkane dehalogenase
MKVLRTPEGRFDSLDGFVFRPRHVEVDGLRMHYVDEGPASAPVVLLLHGEPTWSYLYRKMIPVLVSAGVRAVAPDLIGFGRSDKPADPAAYTYASHMAWLYGFVERLELTGFTLFGQDWGGLLGLRLAAENPERVARIVAANTFLPTGDLPLGSAFERWRAYAETSDDFPIGQIVQRGCVSKLPEEVVAAYDAPFPDESFKVAARRFPQLVPATPDDPAAAANRRAWEVLTGWEKPFLTLFADSDPITRGADVFLQAAIPGAAGQPHDTIAGAGHFLQEDRGEVIAEKIVAFLASS